MNSNSLHADLLQRIAGGSVSVTDAMRQIEAGWLDRTAQRAIDGATVDLGRPARCGFGEVIFGEGKSDELISQIIQTQLDAGQSALVTRVEAITAQKVRITFPYSRHNATGHTLRVDGKPLSEFAPLSESAAAATLHVAVVTAGSTDSPVAEEAIETLDWMGIPVQRIEDIGVAGPQRFLSAIPRLRLASAVVVIAGMEGALPSAIAGHLSAPVFAVPTSVGYGATLGGITPLLGMLSSSAGISGSFSNTSRPAPPMTPLCNAAIRSGSLTTAPRLVLIRQASDFIALSSSAAIRW